MREKSLPEATIEQLFYSYKKWVVDPHDYMGSGITPATKIVDDRTIVASIFIYLFDQKMESQIVRFFPTNEDNTDLCYTQIVIPSDRVIDEHTLFSKKREVPSEVL